MTQNRRIFLNVVATYGRSLYALVIGLFCGRWTLMALGEVDYGLYGVVGGMTAFVTFLNGVMAGGVGRFYAVSVGAAKVNRAEGLRKCREWFSIAVIIHTILPLILLAVGYPLGEWAVRHYLTIPPDRMDACVWVWRFTCVSCLSGMMSVPYVAMYGAKQEIAEQTLYGFATSTLNALFLYYAISHPCAWLAKYAAWSCFLVMAPTMLMSIRSLVKFEECRWVSPGRKFWGLARQMASFSGWFLIGNAAHLLSTQGVSIVVNKFFGPAVNAAQTIGNTLATHCTTLSGSLTGALWPAITNLFGGHDLDKMRRFTYSACRLGVGLLLPFAIPLGIEVDEILRLWLVQPPQFASGLCLIALTYAVVDISSMGFAIAVHASGRVSRYQMAIGGFNLLTLPVALALAFLGGNVYLIMGAVAFMRFAMGMLRITFARHIVGMSGRYWLFKIACPTCLVVLATLLVGLFVRHGFSPSFCRVCMTTAASELVCLPLIWFLLLSQTERDFVVRRVCMTIGKGI